MKIVLNIFNVHFPFVPSKLLCLHSMYIFSFAYVLYIVSKIFLYYVHERSNCHYNVCLCMNMFMSMYMCNYIHMPAIRRWKNKTFLFEHFIQFSLTSLTALSLSLCLSLFYYVLLVCSVTVILLYKLSCLCPPIQYIYYFNWKSNLLNFFLVCLRCSKCHKKGDKFYNIYVI